jgi:hypothetical protein
MFGNAIYRPFIIIGMHRSGTSFLAEALNDAGICMGVFREHNGEALHFLSLNQQMMSAAGGDWLDPVSVADSKVNTMTAEQIFAEHVKCRYHQKWRLRCFQAQSWGWKDPRNTFTLGYWLKVFPNARVIHLVRNGCDVAQSLHRRNQVPGEVHDSRLNDLQFCFSLWEKYTLEGQKKTEMLGNKALELSYESLISEDEQSLKRLQSFVGRDVKFHVKKQNRKHVNYPDALREAARSSELFQNLGYRL